MMTFLKHGNIPVGCVTLWCHQIPVLVGGCGQGSWVPCLMSGGCGKGIPCLPFQVTGLGEVPCLMTRCTGPCTVRSKCIMGNSHIWTQSDMTENITIPPTVHFLYSKLNCLSQTTKDFVYQHSFFQFVLHFNCS